MASFAGAIARLDLVEADQQDDDDRNIHKVPHPLHSRKGSTEDGQLGHTVSYQWHAY